jgi:hypothetical protein
MGRFLGKILLGTQENLMERLKKIRLTPQQGSAVSLRILVGLGMMMTVMTATISATCSMATCIRCLVGGMAVEEAEQGSWMVTVGAVGSGVNHQEEELISWIPHLCHRGSHPPRDEQRALHSLWQDKGKVVSGLAPRERVITP